MRVFRSWGPERTEEALRLCTGAKEGLEVSRRQAAAEGAGVARCPRCGGELMARMSRGEPGFFCRCPVRRVRAEAA
jgi:hypothetical protein